MSSVTCANPQLGWGRDWTRNTTPETPVFRYEINALADFRGGVEVALHFALSVLIFVKHRPFRVPGQKLGLPTMFFICSY